MVFNLDSIFDPYGSPTADLKGGSGGPRKPLLIWRVFMAWSRRRLEAWVELGWVGVIAKLDW